MRLLHAGDGAELTLSLPVTAQAYRGQGPQVDATFTLNATHP